MSDMLVFPVSSPAIGAVAKAMVAAQQEIGPALKDRQNPHLKSMYATLSSVYEASIPALNKHGLALIHMSIPSGPLLYVHTRIIHAESGEWIGNYMPVKSAKDDAQGLGSGVTYARRYGASALLSLATEDDDGETAVGRGSDNSKASTKRSNADDSRSAGEDTRGRTNERSGDSGRAGNGGASNANTSTSAKQEVRQEVKPGTPTYSAETQSIINAMLGVFSTKAKEPDFQKDDTRMKGMQNIAKGYGFEKVGRFIMDSDVPHAIAMEMGDAGYTAAAKIISANGNKLSKAIEAGKANEILACFPKIGL